MADRRESNPKRQLGLETCPGCAGTGTEVVVHGDTSFSGDDACPGCKGSGKVSSKAGKAIRASQARYEY